MKSKLIQNRDRAKQILAFDDMKYGKCTPTDIDLSIDWKGKVFVFAELKGKGKTFQRGGQRYHLQALVKAIRAGGRMAWVILAYHDTKNTDHDVAVKESNVYLVYDGDMWRKPEDEINLNTYINSIYSEHVLSNEEEKEGSN